MKKTFLVAPLLGFAAALPAHALEFGDGWTASGEFELEYFDSSGGGGETLGYATADIDYQQPAGGFGGFVGFDAVSVDSINELAVYGALSYSGGFGKVQVGVPRAVLDDYLDTPALGGLRFYDLLLSGVNGSVVTQAYLLQDTDVPIGMRYDATFGDAKIGASYHHIEDADVYDLAVNYQLGTTTLRAGVEHLEDGGTSGTSYSLGADAEFGPVQAGVLLSDSSDVFGNRVAQLYAIYSPMDRLNLTGTIWAIDDPSGSATLYGLAADYTFGQGPYVEAGFADGDDSSSIYNLSLGLKF